VWRTWLGSCDSPSPIIYNEAQNSSPSPRALSASTHELRSVVTGRFLCYILFITLVVIACCPISFPPPPQKNFIYYWGQDQRITNIAFPIYLNSAPYPIYHPDNMVNYRLFAFISTATALPLNINLGAYSPALVVGRSLSPAQQTIKG